VLRHELRLLLVALQFLTRLPVPSWRHFKPEWLHQSARYFALVGGFVGSLVAAVFAAAHGLWPPPIAAVLALAFGVWLTGGFHEDGLADTWDGLGGSVTRERALEIMKDSRLGSYGALALGLVMATKLLSLWAAASLAPAAAIVGLVLGHTAARAGTVLLIRWMRYAGDEAHAKAKPLAQRASGASVAVALLTVALVAAAAVRWGVPLALVAAVVLATLLAAAATGAWLQHRLGGYTGDGLGAAEQHGECTALLAVVALWPWLGTAA
jgi:adenosylcobinamide-GDP ribazoletransferase